MGKRNCCFVLSHLTSPGFASGLSPEKWALQALCFCYLLHRSSSSYGHWLPKPAEEALSLPRYSYHHLWQSYFGENQTASNQPIGLGILLMNTAAFPVSSEGTFCKRMVMWRLAGVLCRGRYSELRINYFTCHYQRGEGGLASYVCPRCSWQVRQEIISSAVTNRRDSP